MPGWLLLFGRVASSNLAALPPITHLRRKDICASVPVPGCFDCCTLTLYRYGFIYGKIIVVRMTQLSISASGLIDPNGTSEHRREFQSDMLDTLSRKFHKHGSLQVISSHLLWKLEQIRRYQALTRT